MRIAASLVGTVLAAASGWTQASPPAGWQVTGKCEQTKRGLAAQEPVTVSAPLDPDTVTRLSLCLGAVKRRASCRVEAKDGKPLELYMEALDAEYRVGLIGKEVIALPDSCVDIGLSLPGEWLFRDQYFIRPHPHWYEGEDRRKVLADWSKLPSATQHELALKIETAGEYIGVWVDDRFVGGSAVPGYTGLRFALSPGNVLGGVTVVPRPAWRDSYVPVGLQGYRRPGPLNVEELPVARGVAEVKGVPFEVSAEGDEIDVGVSRWLAEKTGPEEFTDNYYTRSAFDSRPEDVLLAVPTDDYSFAHVLCVVDPDSSKTPVLTLRLTRYLKDYFDSGGRGAAIADSSIRLEKQDGKWPEGCEQFGIVKVRTAGGEKTLPLLHVAVPLRCGHIQDVLEEKGIYIGRSTQSLDLELTKELHHVQTANHGAFSIKPLGNPSAVHVLALTLERAPVKVRLRSSHVGNIFYAAERPAVEVEMVPLAARQEPRAPFRGKLAWRITDYYGKTTKSEREVTVPAQSGQKPYSVSLDLRQPICGWFAATLTLRDDKRRLVWERPTSFAILPPDTRKAGRESPYGIWWFRSGHIGSDSIEEIAPLLQRLGFRHVCPSGLGQKPEGGELTTYGISISMYADYVRAADKGPSLLDQAVREHPGVGWALIFHECGFGEDLVYPPEFLGREAPKLTEGQKRSFQEWWDKAVAYSKHCRDKHPDVKLILGNSSLPFAVEFMRQGYPRDLVDAFGDEDLGQSIMPEAPPSAFKSVFWTKEYAKLYKYDVPVTSCYEWRGRGTNPGNLSELEQAQLYVRDALQGLAYRMPNINPGLLYDCSDSYYYSRWGSGGLCHRYPLLNPKISYVALSTLTRELDQAVYKRYLDTGSPSLYAMEFAKDDGAVYALWLPRGEREVAITFAKDTTFTLTDMNGNARELKTRSKRADIVVSASPSYLKARGTIESLRGGPTSCEPAPAKHTVVDPLTDLQDWEVVKEPDKELDTCHFDFPRHLGEIDRKVVSDDRMRQVLQLTLSSQPEVPWPVSRYIVLKATDSKPAPGKPTSVGVWVKGNSCWGRVFFGLEDAKGERFYSLGAPCGGWSVGDWKCKTFINFDGWNYLSVRLPFKHESGFYGPPQHNWTCTGGDGNVDYPIRFTRLVVEMRDKVVYLTDTVEVPEKNLRLRDLSVF